MENSEVTKLVICFKDEDDDFAYITHVYIDGNDEYQTTNCYDFEDALDLSPYSQTELVKIYRSFFETYGDDYDCEIVNITKTIKIAPYETEDDTIKELTQKHALSKLTEREIRALGIVNIATYIKTKFHNA
jgi:hypothetical protein